MEDENGFSGSAGSEIVGVTLGKKVNNAATPPTNVAKPSSMPSGDIPALFLPAFCRCFFGLGGFGALFDIARLSIKVYPKKHLDIPQLSGYSYSSEASMANVLNTDKKIAINGALAEGSSIRSIDTDYRRSPGHDHAPWRESRAGLHTRDGGWRCA
jgi:hypothetical protein